MKKEQIKALGYFKDPIYGFVSNKRRLGTGTGDDSNLIIDWDEDDDLSHCMIYWRSRRGDETTIFDGYIDNITDLTDLLNNKLKVWD